jgi:23S rRNA-intervening sequence protein
MPTPRPAAESFRDLVVWRKAHEFVLAVYRFTESFPDREKFGLSYQMRRRPFPSQPTSPKALANAAGPTKLGS